MMMLRWHVVKQQCVPLLHPLRIPGIESFYIKFNRFQKTVDHRIVCHMSMTPLQGLLHDLCSVCIVGQYLIDDGPESRRICLNLHKVMIRLNGRPQPVDIIGSEFGYHRSQTKEARKSFTPG